MSGKIIRKILVVLIIIIPLFVGTDCKKQAKCGCDGDILFTLTQVQATIYFNSTGTTVTCSLLSSPYDQYYFCNPGEMFPKLSESKSGDVLIISGHAYWECNYLQQSSNSSQRSFYKVYNLQVTDLHADLYGKK